MGAALAEWDDILEELRYKLDQVIVSPTYGEFVFLKEIFNSARLLFLFATLSQAQADQAEGW